MKVVFSALKYDYNDITRGYSFEYENFYKALLNMENVEVIFFDTCDFWNIDNRRKINEELIKLIEKEKPDILFNVFYRDQISKETYLYIKHNTDTLLVNWFCDDHWRFNGSDNPSSKWCWCFDYCITTDAQAIEKYKSIGYENIILSQWGCNHNNYYYKKLPYKYDVTFVGQPHGNRRAVIEYLKDNGIEVRCFGYGWDINDPSSSRITQEEMIDIFNESRINLNLSNSSVVDTPEQIKGRNFEVPGCKGFLLTNEVVDLEKYYIIGEEIECYGSLEDLVNKIKYYLTNENRRREITEKSYKRTLKDHTYEKRFSDIFNYVLKSKRLIKSKEINFDIVLRNKKTEMKDLSKQTVAIFTSENEKAYSDFLLKGLTELYYVKKVVEKDLETNIKEAQMADICYFTSISDVLINLSNIEIAKNKKIICRINNEEIYLEKLFKVNWNNVDGIQCSNEEYKDLIINIIRVSGRKVFVITEGINVNEYSYENRQKGFNIAFYGNINYETGSMLLLQAFKRVHSLDNRYRLHLSGYFTDYRDQLYFMQMLKELELKDSVVLYDYVPNFDVWINDKDYLIITSEYQLNIENILKAMCKGIKPLIHNFVGSEGIPRRYKWNTIGELISKVLSYDYNSSEYADFVKQSYNNAYNINYISSLIDILTAANRYKKSLPLITIGVTNYNYGKYIGKCLESIVNQNYRNLEVIVIDDCSSDDSVKIIKDYQQRYEFIKPIYHSKNSGSGLLTIHEVIEEASGEYFIILDADDYFPSEDTIESYVSAFALNPDIDYIYANRVIVDENEKMGDTWTYKYYENDDIIYEVFKRAGSGVIPMYGMFRTDFYKRDASNWYYDEEVKIGYDTLNCLINAKKGWRCKHIDKTLLCYRHHNGNISYDVKKRIISLIKIVEFIINNFNEEIYFKEIEWDKYQENEKDALKNLLIGNYYFEFYKIYFFDKWKPWEFDSRITKMNMSEYLGSVEDKIKQYLNKCLDFSNIYNEETEKILNSLKTLKIVSK